MAQPLPSPDDIMVSIEGDEGEHFDPETNSITTPDGNGGVVVQLDVGLPKEAKEGGESEFYANLAEEMDGGELSKIANDLIERVKADDQSRQGWLQNYARALDLLGLELKDPRSQVSDSPGSMEGMSTVTNPLLLDALLHSWANAEAELLPASGPVKIEVDGEETDQSDQDAEALERGMNHYLTVTAPEFRANISHMLLWGSNFSGSGFIKVIRDPMRRRPTAEQAAGKDVIVSDTTKDLRACERVTHEIMMRPSVYRRMVFINAYRDVLLMSVQPQPGVVGEKIAAIQGVNPNPQERPEDQPYKLWEVQCLLDLDEYAPKSMRGEGLMLPYLVTLDVDSLQVLALRRDWEEDDPICERLQMWVKFPYVPGPGFYGTGLLNILGNCSAAMTAAWRLSLDAAMFANFPAFLIAKLAGRQNTSDLRVAPGTGVPIETNGMPIAQVATALPYKDLTGGMLQLMEMITTQAGKLASGAEVPTGEGMSNVPVGTILAAIEQTTKIMAAAHKGQHAAMGEVVRLLVRLFKQHPEDFWRGNRIQPGYWDEQKLLAALANNNLVPVSDPNTPSHMHRVTAVSAAVQAALLPLFQPLINAKELLIRVLRVLRVDPVGLVQDPPPQAGMDPKMMAAQLKYQETVQKLPYEMAKLQTETRADATQSQAEIIKAQLDLEQSRVDHASDQQKYAFEGQKHRHEMSMDQANFGLDATKTHHDMKMDLIDRQQAAQQMQHDAASAMQDRALQAQGQQQDHAVAVHQATKPTNPTGPKKNG
jgi:hypothetical protein